MMAPPPMAPPIAPITEGLGGFGGSSAGRAGFSERMQRMTAPPKPKPMPQPVQRMSYGGMVGQAALREGTLPAVPPPFQTVMPGANPFNPFMPQAPKISEQYQPYMPQQGSANALNQYGEYLDNQYGDPQFEQKRDNFLQGIAQQERQTFGGGGGFRGEFITERPGPQRYLGDSEYLSGIFGSQAGDYQDLANYQVAGARPMANGGSVPRRTEISGQPHMLAYINPEEENLLRGLGGSGNPGPGGVPAYAREDGPGSDYFGTAASNYGYGSSGNSSDSSYEDEAYGDDGYGRVDYGGGGGDDSGGDDDDYYNYLDDDYVYVAPTIAEDLVVVPPPEESGSDSEQRMIQDLIYGPADPTIGPNNAQEAMEQALADNKPVVDPMSLETVAPTELPVLSAPKSIDAVGAAPVVSAGGAGPELFTDVPDILGQNPISLLSPLAPSPISVSGRQTPGGGIVPSGPIDFGGSYVPPRVSRSTLSPDFAQPELLNENETEAFFRRDTRRPDMLNIALPGGSSKTRIEDAGYANAMAAAKQVDASRLASNLMAGLDGSGFGYNFPKDMVLPGDIPTQSTQSFNIPNRADAGRAALDLLRAEEKRGITSLSNMAEKNEELRKELEILQGRAGERFANNIDEATSFYKPEGTGMDALNQMLSDPANYEINRVGRLSPEELAQSPFGETEAKYVVPPIGAPITDAELNEARKIYGDFDPTLGAPYVAPSSDIELEVAQPTGGGLMSGTPGMQSYLEDYPAGTGGTEFVAPIGTRRRSDGRTVSGIAPSPAPAVIRPQNTKYLSPFDISELENAARDYRETGAGSSDYDPMAAQATAEALKRAEGDVSALDRIAEARMPTDDMQIVDDMRSVPRSSPEFAAPVGDLAQFEPQVRADSSQTATVSDPDGSGTDIFDSYAALTRSMKAPNKGETNLIRNAMAGARHTEDGPGYKKGDLVVEDRFADKLLSGFETALSFLLPGETDFKAMSQANRNKALQAYKDTGKIVYEEGKPVGFEDKEGGLVRLVPKGQEAPDQDDGCPPGFRRINGVCMPIQRVAQNPATAISDSINKATLPNTLRPVVRDVVDDEDEEEETSDVGGLTIRRPNYFAGGGAVSDGMGSAIDSFISAMGGSVKKKSDVEPVNMFFGGLVDRFTGRNDYTDPYEELERDYGYDPTDPFGDGNTSYGDDGPSDTVTADTFIGPMQPNVTYQPPAAPVDTGGDETDPFVKNAILSARNYYNDGSVGPTMQNASMLPAAPVNTAPQYGPSVDDRYAIDMTKYVPPGLRDVTQTLFDNDLASFNPVAGIYRAMDASGRIGKSISKGEEVDKNDMLTAGIETAIPALTLGVGKFLQQPVKQVVGNMFGIDVANPQKATNIKPSNETLTFYKGSPVAYAPEPGFPLGRDRSDYSGTGEGNRPMGSPEALGEAGVPSGKAYGAGAYQSMSPSTATGYRFMRSGLDRDLSAAAMKAAQERVDFADAGGRPDNFQTIFSEKIDAVDNAVKDASLGVKAAENVYADANRTAAERILDSSIFDTSRFRGDPRREIDPQGFYRSVVFGANDQIDEELYAIRDMISNRGNMDYGDPGYSKRMREINRDFPNLTNLTNKQIAERRAELRDLSKQYTGDVSKKYIDLTQTYRIAQDAEKAKKNLTDFKTAVTGDLPGVLYKTQIQEGKLGSSFEYGNPADNQILTQATNALGVDAMNAKLFGTGPDAKKLQYNPKTQQYSLPLGARGQKVTLDERMLAPKTVAEAELYYKGGITHGQHTDRAGVTNKIFFSDPVTPVPVGRYNRGGQVGMGLGSL